MACSEIGTDWLSPRISFSHDLSQADRISPEKRKREDAVDESYSTEFEFCMISNNNDNSRTPVFGNTLLSADELFVDGKILPRIQPVEAQPITIARHLSLESSRCPSPVRSASYPPSQTMPNECSGTGTSKCCRKGSNKWKELFKLSKENNNAESRASSKEGSNTEDAKSGNNVKQPSSPRSLWPFSRSCSLGGESKANSLFCSLPFSRSNSTCERKPKAGSASCTRSKSVGAQSTSKGQASSGVNSSSRVPLLREEAGLVAGSKQPEPSGVLDGTQRLQGTALEPWPQCLGEFTPKFPSEEGKLETKMPKQRNKGYGSPGRALRMRGGLSSPARHHGRGSPARSGNGRFMIRNLERCSTKALDSPRPGRQMEGVIKPNFHSSGVRVNPVLNVPAYMGTSRGIGGRNGNGLFSFGGFFSKKDKKHHPVSTNRKKGA